MPSKKKKKEGGGASVAAPASHDDGSSLDPTENVDAKELHCDEGDAEIEEPDVPVKIVAGDSDRNTLLEAETDAALAAAAAASAETEQAEAESAARTAAAMAAAAEEEEEMENGVDEELADMDLHAGDNNDDKISAVTEGIQPAFAADCSGDTEKELWFEVRRKAREQQDRLRAEAGMSNVSLEAPHSPEKSIISTTGPDTMLRSPASSSTTEGRPVVIKRDLLGAGLGFELDFRSEQNTYGEGTRAIVSSVNPKGPAAGKLLPGDHVVSIGGIALALCPPSQCKSLLKGIDIKLMVTNSAAPKSSAGFEHPCRTRSRRLVLTRASLAVSFGFEIAIKRDGDLFGAGSTVSVRSISAGGLAATMGDPENRLKVGDLIFDVNGVSMALCHPKYVPYRILEPFVSRNKIVYAPLPTVSARQHSRFLSETLINALI